MARRNDPIVPRGSRLHQSIAHERVNGGGVQRRRSSSLAEPRPQLACLGQASREPLEASTLFLPLLLD
jgi:hypothetical protein